MMTWLFLLMGLAVLVCGAELLVRGASRLALGWGVSPLVVGLTIVAFGTSTPELAVSLKAAWANHPDLVLGNCVGSNIFNILFILGICALISPLIVLQQLVRIDVPIMIGVHIVLLLFAYNSTIGPLEGFLFILCLIAYTAFVVYKSKQESETVVKEYNDTYSISLKNAKFKNTKSIVYVLLGLGLCVIGAGWMTDSAVAIARALGLSELVIGLTIIAASTSIPEVATSVVATIRGQRDIAIGNVVGSNIFNVLGIIGITSLVSPHEITVAPSVISFDIPVALACCVACLPIFFTEHKITRGEGVLFLGYYVAYISYLLLSAAKHDSLPLFNQTMFLFVIPLTFITLFILAYRAFKVKKHSQ
ncbi:MAG: sodium:calcium antiporter [Chlamydiales bacterium 38-26]|nr:calcium/sodium antiporter [Chlamydiales bacterium]OJV07634.1 MAG: sodium:calcium antiporter [Chlamydiales bacterium 38-26]